MSFDNFVQTTLSVALTATANILTLSDAIAPYRLPPTDGGVVVLADSIGRPTYVEIISYAARSGFNLTGVVRGLEGTTARAWGIGTPLYQPLTATGFQSALDAKLPLAGGTLSGPLNMAPPPTLTSTIITDIGAASSNNVYITGTATIHGFGNKPVGTRRYLTFLSSLVLTHHATNLILPGAANITVQGGDTAEFVSTGPSRWRCTSYMRADGTPLVNTAMTPQVKSADFTATVNVGYWLSTTLTVTLPSYAGLAAGARISFDKALAAVPIIQAAVDQNIRASGGLDTSVQYNINAALIFTYNGTEWEV